jgi:hypothetical protein
MQFFTPALQGLISLNHDIEARGQFKQDFGLLARIAKLFWRIDSASFYPARVSELKRQSNAWRLSFFADQNLNGLDFLFAEIWFDLYAFTCNGCSRGRNSGHPQASIGHGSDARLSRRQRRRRRT